MVSEAFAAEQPDLQPLAPSPFNELPQHFQGGGILSATRLLF
jgi:hypothetical protein